MSRPLRTDEEVAALVSWLRRPIIGTAVRCGRADHTAPMRFLADVLVGRVADYIVWANRSGSKSYLAALVTWVRSWMMPGLETTILGGSFEQAERVYRAIDEFWEATGLADELIAGERTRRLTSWVNGSAVAVLTASERSTRGPHPQAVIMDEIDEMDADVYASALSQPMSKRGIAASLGRFSTCHRADGVMEHALAQAEAAGLPVYRWCVWECLASCRDWSCSRCRLAPWCPGESMREADGYYAVEDFVKKIETLSEDALRTEWLCERVGRGEMVYGAYFSMDEHAPLDAPAFAADRPARLSVDWGGAAPFSLGVWQTFEVGGVEVEVRVDELYMPGTNQALIAAAQRRPWWPVVPRWPEEGGVADPSRPDLIAEWRAAGVRLVPADNDIDRGIEAVRVALRPVVGRARMMINRRCTAWLREVQSYALRGGRPVKANDHAMDDTRYYALWRMGGPRRRGRVFSAGRPAATTMEASHDHNRRVIFGPRT